MQWRSQIILVTLPPGSTPGMGTGFFLTVQTLVVLYLFLFRALRPVQLNLSPGTSFFNNSTKRTPEEYDSKRLNIFYELFMWSALQN